MRFQMRFLSIIEGLEQCTLVDRRAGIADVRDMRPDSTDFFYEVLAMLITATKPAGCIGAGLSGAVLATQSRGLDFTGKPILTGVKRVSRLASGDLYRILAYFPGDGRGIFMQLGSDLLERRTLFQEFLQR